MVRLADNQDQLVVKLADIEVAAVDGLAARP